MLTSVKIIFTTVAIKPLVLIQLAATFVTACLVTMEMEEFAQVSFRLRIKLF